MSYLINYNKEKAITSAKHIVQASIIASSAVLSGCGVKESTEAAIIDNTAADTTNKEDVFTSEVLNGYAKEEIKVYSDLGETEVETYAKNTALNIVAVSEDGKWYQTEEGYFILKSDLAAEPSTYVKESTKELVYTQYQGVNVHSDYDKTSEVICSLNANTCLLRTGEVEFAVDGEISEKDATRDHGWSRVEFKRDGELVVGYVYADYVDVTECETEVLALEAPVYSEEERVAVVEAYKVENPEYISNESETDEELYYMEQELEETADEEVTVENVTEESSTEDIYENIDIDKLIAEAIEDVYGDQSSQSASVSSAHNPNWAEDVTPAYSKPIAFAEYDKYGDESWYVGYYNSKGELLYTLNEYIYGRPKAEEHVRSTGMTMEEYNATYDERHHIVWDF